MKKECFLKELTNIDTFQITQEDFEETIMLESLLLGHNQITSLNNSLANLQNLNFLNMTYNLLTEVSFQEIVGLEELISMDLSHNRITTLIGPIAVSRRQLKTAQGCIFHKLSYFRIWSTGTSNLAN